jgi:hypothetical protein
MADDDGAAIPDGMPGAIAPHPVTRLKPLVGQATHDGLALELVELKLTDGLVAVFEATRAGKTERFTMDVQTVSSAAPHGVTFWVTDVGVPSEPVYVEVSFVQPPSFWE